MGSTDQSSYQIPTHCDLFGICNSSNSSPWNLPSPFVTCTIRDICGATTLFLAVQTLYAVSGESKALFRAITSNIFKKYFGDILQLIKKKLCNTNWPIYILSLKTWFYLYLFVILKKLKKTDDEALVVQFNSTTDGFLGGVIGLVHYWVC